MARLGATEFTHCPTNAWVVLWTPERGLEAYHATTEEITTRSDEDKGLDGLLAALRAVEGEPAGAGTP